MSAVGYRANFELALYPTALIRNQRCIRQHWFGISAVSDSTDSQIFTFEYEYLREFETEFENSLGCESGAHWYSSKFLPRNVIINFVFDTYNSLLWLLMVLLYNWTFKTHMQRCFCTLRYLFWSSIACPALSTFRTCFVAVWLYPRVLLCGLTKKVFILLRIIKVFVSPHAVQVLESSILLIGSVLLASVFFNVIR